MKKFVRVSLAILLALVLCAAFCACSPEQVPEEPVHVHVYDDDCDAACNECSEERDVSHKFTESEVCQATHTLTCQQCGCSVTEEHSLSDDLCTACQFRNEPPVKFGTGWITEEDTVIETERVRIVIDPNVYVVSDADVKMEKALDVLETVSGLSFTECRRPGQILCEVEKVDATPYPASFQDSEMGSAWASDLHLLISSGDFFLGNSSAVLHEASHVLRFAQARGTVCTTLEEGFAEYNCYKAVRYLEQNDPEFANCIDSSFSTLFNMMMEEPMLYTQSLEYWMQNEFPYEYAGNGSYAVGFRFMAYLDSVYGDYSKWIRELPNKQISTKEQIKVLKKAYGDDVLDGFYPWMQEHEHDFDEKYGEYPLDLTQAHKISIYPGFNAVERLFFLQGHNAYKIRYNNLFINIEEGRKYLSEYKSMPVDSLVLELDREAKVRLYDSQGALIRIVESARIPLDGVSYICLDGKGTLNSFEIRGFADNVQ